MAAIETGLLLGRIPYIRSGFGSRRAVVFLGGNALLRRLDQTANPERYARQIAALLPSDFTFWIFGYDVDSEEPPTLDGISGTFAHAIQSEIGIVDVLIWVSFGGFVAQSFALV